MNPVIYHMDCTFLLYFLSYSLFMHLETILISRVILSLKKIMSLSITSSKESHKSTGYNTDTSTFLYLFYIGY